MSLKIAVRGMLRKSDLWYSLSLVRRVPEIVEWLAGGCIGKAPDVLKMRIVSAYRKKFSLGRFVETGTYLGETLGFIARTGVQCNSIELSPELHQAARQRFEGFRNVHLILGDSGRELPILLEGICGPTLFWLDGHYSGGVTACADVQTPISIELQAILRHPVKSHVVLIDDARCFDGKSGYPHLDDLLAAVRADGSYDAEVSTDIIRLVPKSSTAAVATYG